MCGESGRGRNGTVHRYYKCVSVKKKRTDCKKKAVKKEWIENLVISQTMKLINDEETEKLMPNRNYYEVYLEKPMPECIG